MKSMAKAISRLLTACAVFLAAATALTAQDQTASQLRLRPNSSMTQVERGEVVYVSGNDLVVRMENGDVRRFDVPEDARVTVDGMQLSVHELSPGMKLQRSITTISTPTIVTKVRTIQGRVWRVIAPLAVILTLPDGTNKQYRVPKDQTFVIDGQDKTVFELRQGMNVTATVVTERPSVFVAAQRSTTGSTARPPAPPTPVMTGVLLIEEAISIPIAAAPPLTIRVPAAATGPVIALESAPEPVPASLPRTGSAAPLVGLSGLLSGSISIGLRMLRRRAGKKVS